MGLPDWSLGLEVCKKHLVLHPPWGIDGQQLHLQAALQKTPVHAPHAVRHSAFCHKQVQPCLGASTRPDVLVLACIVWDLGNGGAMADPCELWPAACAQTGHGS